MRYCRRRRKHGAETAVDGVGDVQTRWCIAHCPVACEVTFLFGVGEGREVGSGRAAARGSRLRLNASLAALCSRPWVGGRLCNDTSTMLAHHFIRPPIAYICTGSDAGRAAAALQVTSWIFRTSYVCADAMCPAACDRVCFRDPSSVSRCRRPAIPPLAGIPNRLFFVVSFLSTLTQPKLSPYGPVSKYIRGRLTSSHSRNRTISSRIGTSQKRNPEMKACTSIYKSSEASRADAVEKEW